jgi:hypothetical protein
MPIFVHGHVANVQITNSSDVLVDLSAYIHEIDIAYPIDIHDTTTLGLADHASQPGLMGGDDVTVRFYYHATPEAQLASLLGRATSSQIQLGPEGTATGKLKVTVSVWLKSFKPGIKVADMEGIEAIFHKTGAITRAVF